MTGQRDSETLVWPVTGIHAASLQRFSEHYLYNRLESLARPGGPLPHSKFGGR
jgi:hypothetical protein